MTAAPPIVEPVLEVRGITKQFPGVRALDNVWLKVRPGEIHALVGENGAGKSTLVKILSGVYPAGSYSGQILLNGHPLRFRTPHDARRAGIAYVPQEINVIEDLSVGENVFVGNWRQGPGWLVRFGSLHERARRLFAELSIDEDPRRPMAQLPAGRRQLVMLARALATAPALLILDEPTSSLTQGESANLLALLGRLKQRGKEHGGPFTCIYISHRLEEVVAVADRATVLRDGAVTATFDRADFDRNRVITAMVGRTIDNLYPARNRLVSASEVLRVEGLSVPHPTLAGRNVVEGVSFAVRRGEILGIGGLVGSGRSEVLNAIYGRLPHEGRILIDGRPVVIRRPRDAMRHGLALLTEERKHDGLLFNFAIRENITINSIGRVARGMFLSRRCENRLAEDYRQRLSIRAPSILSMVEDLSGGNQQKTLLARALMVEPRILLLDEPTKGIDIGAKTEIFKLMADLSRQGMAMVMVSSELPELLAMSDRIVVLARGRLAGEFAAAQATQERIMQVATQTTLGASEAGPDGE
jgi:ABC-type sugar transport system ATPase subunit